MEHGLRDQRDWSKFERFWVLILLLMEYGLRDKKTQEFECPIWAVLILLLMEYGLRDRFDFPQEKEARMS